jgi:hypothetical protein
MKINFQLPADDSVEKKKARGRTPLPPRPRPTRAITLPQFKERMVLPFVTLVTKPSEILAGPTSKPTAGQTEDKHEN